MEKNNKVGIKNSRPIRVFTAKNIQLSVFKNISSSGRPFLRFVLTHYLAPKSVREKQQGMERLYFDRAEKSRIVAVFEQMDDYLNQIM